MNNEKIPIWKMALYATGGAVAFFGWCWFASIACVAVGGSVQACGL